MSLQPKVRRGETMRIEAPTFNAFLDAARQHQRSQPRNQIGQPRDTHQSTVVVVRNTDAATYQQFEVLGLESPVQNIFNATEDWKEHPVFNAALPTAQSEGRFCVLQEPCRGGAIARAIISGVTPAKVYLSNSTDEFCDIAAGSPYLHNSPVGSAQILWDQGAPGEQLGIVRLWGKQYGKAFVAKNGSSAISAISGSTPGSGTVTLYQLVSGSLSSTGLTVTAYNMAGEVAANAWLQVKQDAYGVWWVDVENCG